MSELAFEVGVVVARRELRSAWSSVSWRPAAVLAAVPDVEPGALVSQEAGESLFYAGPAPLSIHSSETAHYRDNLRSGRPAIWVALACDGPFPSISMVTADPYEGEALAEVYGEGLDAVPMPESLRDALADFVAQHHVERVFHKRKRT